MAMFQAKLSSSPLSSLFVSTLFLRKLNDNHKQHHHRPYHTVPHLASVELWISLLLVEGFERHHGGSEIQVENLTRLRTAVKVVSFTSSKG